MNRRDFIAVDAAAAACPGRAGGRSARVRSGALASYGPDYSDLFRRAALYVDRVRKDEKAGELPVQVPERFELVINLRTAKALGLIVPPSLLARADEVIE